MWPELRPLDQYNLKQTWANICASRRPSAAVLDQLARQYKILTGQVVAIRPMTRGCRYVVNNRDCDPRGPARHIEQGFSS